MWLLNVDTRELEAFEGRNIPLYAILSHRWEDEEVSFDDIENSPERLKGYYKIDKCCRRALKCHLHDEEKKVYERLEYVWVDKCCIDKRSSAE